MSNFLQKIDASVLEQLQKVAGAPAENQNKKSVPSNPLAWQEYTVNLADLKAQTSKPYSLSGYGLICALSSDIGACVMARFGNGSTEIRLTPGMKFTGRFNQIGLRLASDGIATGKLRLVILNSPDVDFIETLLTEPAPSLQRVLCQINAGTPAQSYSAAKYANNPTGLNTDKLRNAYALNAARCSKVVAFVYCVGAPNLTAGTLLLWQYDTEIGQWFASAVEITLQTGTNRVCTAAMEVGPNIGWIWAEAYGVTNVAATGDVYVYLRGS